jgi:heterodisulfide reductase subunit A
MNHFTDDQIMAQVEAILAKDPYKQLVTFACNWCSYAGGDMAGTSRLFKLGAPIVLVSGCHFADCHYINAVHWTQKRMDKLWNKIDKLGIRVDRLQLEWISAAEGQKFARVMRTLEEKVKQVTVEEIEQTMKILREEDEKQAKKG